MESPDFLVIGAGVAGLRAAIELSQAGNVLVIAKDSLRESSSEYAQGGIAVALSDDDEVRLHEQDTIVAGAGLCNQQAVHSLVEEGPAAIEQLIEWGAEFDRDGLRLAFTRPSCGARIGPLESQSSKPIGLSRRVAWYGRLYFRGYLSAASHLAISRARSSGFASSAPLSVPLLFMS